MRSTNKMTRCLNYAYQFRRVVKVGMEEGCDGRRVISHQYTANVGAAIYGVTPAIASELWKLEGLYSADSQMLESWIKKKLFPYLAVGEEWFHATDEVLKFFESDPYRAWVNERWPGVLFDEVDQELMWERYDPEIHLPEWFKRLHPNTYRRL